MTGAVANKNMVFLNAFDLAEVLLVAERIHAIRSVAKSSKEFNDGVSSFERHYIGAMAEIAVCKYFNVQHPHDIALGGDGGIDLLLNGWKAQVKCRTFTGKNPELIFRSLDYFKAEVAIATRWASPTSIEMLGCITQRKFMKKVEQKNYGYGEHFCVGEKELTDVDVLLNGRHMNE